MPAFTRQADRYVPKMRFESAWLSSCSWHFYDGGSCVFVWRTRLRLKDGASVANVVRKVIDKPKTNSESVRSERRKLVLSRQFGLNRQTQSCPCRELLPFVWTVWAEVFIRSGSWKSEDGFGNYVWMLGAAFVLFMSGSGYFWLWYFSVWCCCETKKKTIFTRTTETHIEPKGSNSIYSRLYSWSS